MDKDKLIKGLESEARMYDVLYQECAYFDREKKQEYAVKERAIYAFLRRVKDGEFD